MLWLRPDLLYGHTRHAINIYGTLQPDGSHAISTSFLSLTASIIYVGELLGALLAAPINDHYGRKGVFYSASACIIAGAIIQVADNGNEGVIVLGRIVIGLGIGQFTVTCVLYIGEVAPLAIRGPALMMFQFMQSCSQLVGSGITQGTESITSTAAFRIPMGLLMLLPLIMLVCLPFIPETPIWLMRKGRPERAEHSLRRINRGEKAYDPSGDMEVLRLAVEKERIEAAESTWTSLVHRPDRAAQAAVRMRSHVRAADQRHPVLLLVWRRLRGIHRRRAALHHFRHHQRAAGRRGPGQRAAGQPHRPPHHLLQKPGPVDDRQLHRATPLCWP